MGALSMGLTEEELPEIVQRWRAANKRIVDLWYAVENAAIQVMRTGQTTGVKNLIISREGDFSTGQDFLTILLPSGRKLFYVRPFLSPNQWGNDSLHYWGMDQQTKKWSVVDTYGGKLVENVVQAIARDCLAESLMRLDQAGYQTVFHIHDEAVIDVPKADAMALENISEIMGTPIPWAPGLLLRAEGFETNYYKKE
mgnify:CR=1 FL=1